MILQKEFYFVRHGQTDHHKGLSVDVMDIPLNDTGVQQAKDIEPLIATLPVRSVCFSPLIRAKQTKEFISARLSSAEYHEIEDLTECCWETWNFMTAHGQKTNLQFPERVQKFMQRAVQGINQALSKPGPVLIVAHGGVHWAMCYFMNASHEWAISHCSPIHFTLGNQGQWIANSLVKAS